MSNASDANANVNFDLICTLPLSADLITLATHPTEPIFVAGFASGFVQAYRLPEDQADASEATAPGSDAQSETNGSSKADGRSVKFSNKVNYEPKKASKGVKRPRRSSLNSSISSPPPSGHTMIETIWRTRRHKGSCRALAFSTDGNTVFSAGTDGIIKAADSYTGYVVGKALVPAGKKLAGPSRLLALNPQRLILGDDEGGVHEYELQQTPFKRGDGSARHAPSAAQPQKTHYPHRTEERPQATDPITSLTALPPSGASTSKIARMWTSTAGSTLAVCDTFKGAVTCSEEQGAGKEPLELISCACVTRPASSTGMDAKAKNNVKGGKKVNKAADENQVVMIIGDSSGGCSAWPRGQWGTRSNQTNIRRNMNIPGLDDEDFGVECLAVGPPSEDDPDSLIVAGLATGRIHFIRLDAQGKPKVLHNDYPHDDQALDGCAAIAFDAHGRMISGGGPTVKVWRRKLESSEVDMADGMDADREQPDESDELDEEDSMHLDSLINGGGVHGEAEIELAADEAESSEEDAEEENDSDDELSKQVKRKSKPKVNSKKRKRGKSRDDGRGAHGILRVRGLM